MNRPTCAVLAVVVFLVVLMQPGATRAQETRAPSPVGGGSSSRCEVAPWVEIELGIAPPLFAQTFAQLSAQLGARGIGACLSSSFPHADPVARLSVADAAGGWEIKVADELTHKRVTRTLPMAAVASSARALTIAIAADELLAAAWAELAFPRVRDATPAAPREVLSLVPEGRPASHVAFAVATGVERYSARVTTFGPEAVGTWTHGALSLGVRATLRLVAPVATAEGSIRGQGFGGAGTAGWIPIHIGRFSLGLQARCDVGRYTFVGAAERGLRSRGGSAVLVTTLIAPVASFGIAGQWRATFEPGIGLPLRAVVLDGPNGSIIDSRGLVMGATVAIGGPI